MRFINYINILSRIFFVHFYVKTRFNVFALYIIVVTDFIFFAILS